ncbi:cadmium-translocating P-type ATPase [Pseudodesulfovibrio sp. F-1]|uniref:P-type Zn(2+) transporter n=1 Tax=Pseudodesulfovibrio alkaliphilus TaxID=2661613 RepID=A0A7K1KKP8_9BACT|nr:cation-translocating P-type ATPase [Pseudodesulfovibrio alkaliphilus]MUM76645.1 cadmium-translocating P-type ATPase [Pseudodesulfovibrio alkaliphilus]
MKDIISTRHAITGRVRFRVRPMLRDHALARRIGTGLEALPFVETVRPNVACASLVVRYQPGEAHLAAIEDALYRLASARDTDTLACIAHDAPDCATPLCQCRACDATRTGCNPVKPALRRFVAISAVLGGVLVSGPLLGIGLAQTAFSPVGIAAAAFSLPLFKQAWQQLRDRRFTLEMFLGASCMAAVFAGEALTAFEILWITAGAELLKAWITERSRKSISRILEVSSHHTFILVDGVEMEKEVADLRPGDVVVLHTSEKVCVDGVIVDGEALMDEASITGRADFVPKRAGDEVLAGTFVRQGVIYVRAQRVGDRTYLARILKMVEDSLENRAPIEGVADRLASTLVKLGFAATAGTWLLTGSLWRAFTVMLVMACPCATVLAASTAVSAALSAAARRNILIKGGRYLEAVGTTDTVCFDKTGTLTTSEPVLARIVPLSGSDTERLLARAVSVEMHNHHPLAQAIKQEADRRGVAPEPHTVCEYFLGMGMRAEVGGSEILVGNARLMERHGVDVAPAGRRAAPLRRQGRTVLYVAEDKALLGLLAFDNLTRPESRQVVDRLRQGGIREVVLITGDEPNTAKELARKLGIATVHASVMPEDKAHIVDAMQTRGASVIMVGDGVNDALALTRADVGVAMGAGGSEVAIEAADIALVTDDLGGLVYVQSLSQATMKVVHQNFWIATGSNVAGVILGASGLLSPVMAGLLHIVHSLGVLANSSRLLRHQPPALAAGTED